MSVQEESAWLTGVCVLAVAFLESMGLPQPMLSVTRKQIEQGKIDYKSSLEYRMYSRHDKPVEDEL